MKKICFFLFLVFAINGCDSSELAQPRPRQYPRIEFPPKSYTEASPEDCDFKLQVPEYSRIQKKEYVFGENPGHPCWFDMVFDQFNATVHLSYYPIDDIQSFDKLVDDAYTMAGKHNVKATFREEYAVQSEDGSTGTVFEIDGPVASPYQFYISDRNRHFLRGSLYFNQKMQRDSLQVVIDFLEQDMDHLINTIVWK